MSPGKFVYYFADELPADTNVKELLGGKGASLKEMTRAGLRVPPGFTISTAACAAYFERGKNWPPGLEAEVRENLARLESETQRRFGAGERPLLVSVRSGAARSMPGMMDTLLNCGLHPGLADDVGDSPAFWQLYVNFIRTFARIVHGLTEEQFAAAEKWRGQETGHNSGAAEASRAWAHEHLRVYESYTGIPFPNTPGDVLAQCINAVFASWHSERAVAYRRRNAIDGLLGTAVNVQMMFPSEVSGVAFTEDPTRLDGRRMVIESSYGLGESVVSGEVTPDRFLVSRDNFDDVTIELGRKAHVVEALGQSRSYDPLSQSLTHEQVRTLANLAAKVEQHYGHPVDLEWGLADGEFALLQARAIRGLDVARDVEIGRQEEVHRLQSQLGGRRRAWVVHNLAETLRAPTPLTWDIMRTFMRGSGGFGRLYRELGYRPSRRVSGEGFLDLICGRIYADPERLAELFWDGMPLEYDVAGVLADKRLLDQAPARFNADRADARFLATLPANLWSMWQTSRRMRARASEVKQEFEAEKLPPFLAYVRPMREQPLDRLSVEQLLTELRERTQRVLDEFGPASLKPGFFGGMALARLEGMLAQLMGPQEGAALASTLTRALDGDTTFEQDVLLFEVAHGRATLAEFIARFGHRCVGEMELAEPRWREDTTYLEQTIARLCTAGRSPTDIHHENVTKREAAEAELPRVLQRWGGGFLRERILAQLAEARLLLPYRESGKHYLMQGYELVRQVLEELDRRFELAGGIYFLRLDELAEFMQHEQRLRDEIRQRRIRWQALQRLDMPDVIDSTELEGLGLARQFSAADEIPGTAIAAGVATGIVRVVHDPRQAGDLGSDYILVCPSTDPGWTPLFLAARGLVVERGGVLSHGAIVARDFGIPAVVCPGATRQMHNGDRVRVDGNHGRVVVVERNGRHA